MLRFIFVFFLTLNISIAQDLADLGQINLKNVSQTYRPLVYSSKKFKLYLMNGFCEESAVPSEIKISKDEIKNNIIYFKKELPKTLEKWEHLIQRISPDFFSKSLIYPLHVYLSIDGSSKCYNAKTEKNHIEFPAHEDPELMKANYALIYHELGHVMRGLAMPFENIFEEAFSDALSLLLFDGNGIFYHRIEEEREEWQRQILLGKRDPHALASELGGEYYEIPGWLKENELKFQCSSSGYYRDLRNSFSISNIFFGGGEPYIVSCAFHSYLRKLASIHGHKNILEKFVKAYLESPQVFADLSVPSILFKLFNRARIYEVDPSLSRLILLKKEHQLKLSKVSHKGDIQFFWHEDYFYKDTALLSLSHPRLGAISSFSINRRDMGFYFSPKTKRQCELDILHCLCGDQLMNLNFDFGLVNGATAIKLSHEIKLTPSPRGCYEVGLLTEANLVKDS